MPTDKIRALGGPLPPLEYQFVVNTFSGLEDTITGTISVTCAPNFKILHPTPLHLTKTFFDYGTGVQNYILNIFDTSDVNCAVIQYIATYTDERIS